MSWSTSKRRADLPADWYNFATRRQVLHEARYRCQIRGPGCTGTATDVDHIGDRDDHSDGNLQSACSTCHKAKTAVHRNAQMARRRELRKRPIERHPGMV